MKRDEMLAYIGVAFVTAGLAFIYWPVAVIFVGGVLFAAAVLLVD